MRNQFLLGAAVVALAVPAAASAQETTSVIRGTVTSEGTPVAGATVVAIDTAQGTRRQVVTGDDGAFIFSGLRTGGPYTVEVTSPLGNKSVTDIFTVVQQEFTLPIELGVAAADAGLTTGDIVVTASSIRGAGVTSDGPQTVLTQEDISKVASVNRDVRDVQRRDPFATLDLSNSGERGGAVSFAGVNPRFNRFTINGVQVGDTFGLNQDASPTGRGPVPFDALAQVSVSVAPYDIRQGNFQGGVIDVTLLSGTNTFHGTGFYSINTDELFGDQIGSNRLPQPNFKSETYGATIRGPIIADKLFFMVSAERNTDPRPFATQIGQVPGFNQGRFDQIRGLASSLYGYNPGGVPSINNRLDEKIVGRIDWNVTDNQRLSLSYVNAFDTNDQQQNTSISQQTPSFGLESNAYALSQLLRAGIVQLNSDWSDTFSTEARFLYRSTKRGQEPLLGRNFAEFRVCSDPTNVGSATQCSTGTPTYAFGPDFSRQTNELFYDTWGGSLLARIELGDHSIRALAEVNVNRTFNNFLQASLGSFYFDSIAAFQARTAQQLTLAQTIDGTPNGAAADFKYTQYTFGLQDDWRVTDTLNVSYGVRADVYGMRDQPVLNQFFTGRYGFPNTSTYKGLINIQPRISFNWDGPDRLRLRGGVGIFGGGSPDIYLSNSFSNTVLANRTDFAPNTCGTAALPQTVCDAALTGVAGSSIPGTVSNFVRNDPRAQPTSTYAAIDPRFNPPSSLRATLSADYNLFGFNIGADYLYNETINGVLFQDLRLSRAGVLPDGRPRYQNFIGLGANNNTDILLTNANLGRSHVGVIRFDKRFDWGLSFGGSYTLQDVRDVAAATSSVASSNYALQAVADPNIAAYGRSNDEITWQFKYNVGFDHAFFGDYRTVVQLFGETRAGRRYSFTMQDLAGSARSAVFGTANVSTGGASRYLLYVPTSGTDPRVSFDTDATRQSLETLIQNTALRSYRGQIAPKNIARSRAITQIDLHLEQELPTGIGNSRVALFADIQNLPNLIDKDWGGLRQLVGSSQAAVVQVQCLSAAVPTGTGVANIGATAAQNPTGLPTVVNTVATQPCAQYRYSSYRDPNEAAVNVVGSLYAIRVGARFSF